MPAESTTDHFSTTEVDSAVYSMEDHIRQALNESRIEMCVEKAKRILKHILTNADTLELVEKAIAFEEEHETLSASETIIHARKLYVQQSHLEALEHSEWEIRAHCDSEMLHSDSYEMHHESFVNEHASHEGGTQCEMPTGKCQNCSKTAVEDQMPASVCDETAVAETQNVDRDLCKETTDMVCSGSANNDLQFVEDNDPTCNPSPDLPKNGSANCKNTVIIAKRPQQCCTETSGGSNSPVHSKRASKSPRGSPRKKQKDRKIFSPKVKCSPSSKPEPDVQFTAVSNGKQHLQSLPVCDESPVTSKNLDNVESGEKFGVAVGKPDDVESAEKLNIHVSSGEPEMVESTEAIKESTPAAVATEKTVPEAKSTENQSLRMEVLESSTDDNMETAEIYSESSPLKTVETPGKNLGLRDLRETSSSFNYKESVECESDEYGIAQSTRSCTRSINSSVPDKTNKRLSSSPSRSPINKKRRSSKSFSPKIGTKEHTEANTKEGLKSKTKEITKAKEITKPAEAKKWTSLNTYTVVYIVVNICYYLDARFHHFKREQDREILLTCQRLGTTNEAFKVVSKAVGASPQQVKKRFTDVMNMLKRAMETGIFKQ